MYFFCFILSEADGLYQAKKKTEINLFGKCLSPKKPLTQNIPHHLPLHIRQPKPPTLKFISKSFMIDAHDV